MDKLISVFLLCMFCIVGNNAASAAAIQEVSSETRANIEKGLSELSGKVGQQLEITEIRHSPVDGLLMVRSGASIFYVTKDGKNFMVGDLIEISKERENWNFTEAAQREVRADIISALPNSELVVFPETAEKIGTVTVFTDIDCIYCRKFHSHIQEINGLGIEVRYAAFPRQGPGSDSFQKAINVWCSEDRTASMTKAKSGEDLPKLSCDNPVADQFALTRTLGITGTPTMILDDGTKIVGYLLPKDLADAISNRK